MYTSGQQEKLQWLRNHHYEPYGGPNVPTGPTVIGIGGWHEDPLIVHLERHAFGSGPLTLKILPSGEHRAA